MLGPSSPGCGHALVLSMSGCVGSCSSVFPVLLVVPLFLFLFLLLSLFLYLFLFFLLIIIILPRLFLLLPIVIPRLVIFLDLIISVTAFRYLKLLQQLNDQVELLPPLMIKEQLLG